MKITKVKYNRDFAFLTFEDDMTIRIDAKTISAFALAEGEEFDRAVIFSANYEYAYNYGTDVAYKYLNYCARTEAQLAEQLAQKYVQPDAALAVCRKMKEYRYCDDNIYAESFVHSCIGQSMGKRLIAGKLKQKGIAAEIADSALCEYTEQQEYEVLLSLIGRLSERLSDIPLRLRRDKIFSRAVAKGFSAREVNRALSESALKSSEADDIAYFAPLIDSEIKRLSARGQSGREIYQKLYAKFTKKGASAELIRKRLEAAESAANEE